MKKTPLLTIVGPTGTGKTDIAMELAQQFNAEIVNADSMQVYRLMDIGTAKPSVNQRRQIPHYLVDFIDPWEDWSVATFQSEATACIKKIASRGKLPILSGGTGLYIHSILYEMTFGEAKGSPAIRRQLYQEVEEYGNLWLHARLQKLDPESAERIHPNNIKKVVRALEVLSLKEKGIDDFQQTRSVNEAYDLLFIGLRRDRKQLYERIDKRAQEMWNAGLAREVKNLLELGMTEDHSSMQGIGYKETIGYLKGLLNEQEVVDLIQKNSRNYAKRQLTWFRRYEEIQWFDLSKFDTMKEGIEQLKKVVEKRFPSDRET